mmetsp:Transcript_9272/g.13361  ORF Transcript_9272/g.13361 Transcript_9272/m.13361 type:complete len:126 (+) Transcript_9272:117-494(+)
MSFVRESNESGDSKISLPDAEYCGQFFPFNGGPVLLVLLFGWSIDIPKLNISYILDEAGIFQFINLLCCDLRGLTLAILLVMISLCRDPGFKFLVQRRSLLFLGLNQKFKLPLPLRIMTVVVFIC